MSTNVQVAVIGAGYFGRFHARHYALCPRATLAAVVDADHARAEAVAAEFGARAFASVDALPPSIVAASVATPTATHHAVARSLLARGLHVLVEKPIAATRAEADDLVDAATAAGRVLQVGHVERFSPAFAALAARSGTPAFLEARRMTEPRARARDVDVVLDLMIHDIDLCMALAASAVADVEAVGAAYAGAGLDVAQARIAFRNGIVAHLSASRVAEAGERTVRAHFDDGHVTADLKDLVLTEVKAAAADGEVDFRVTRRPLDRQDALGAEIAAFLDAVAGRAPPPVTGADGRDALAVALEVSRRAARGSAARTLARSA